MVVSFLFTYTKPFTAGKRLRCSCCATPFKFERAEYCLIPRENKQVFLWGLFSGNVRRRLRIPACVIVYKQTFVEC